MIGNLLPTGTGGPTRSSFSDLVAFKKQKTKTQILQLDSGVMILMRREVVEDGEEGSVCSEAQVRFMDCHGNSSVRVNEQQRSDSAALTSVNKLRFLCPVIVQALILESHTFNVDCHPFDRSALSFIPFPTLAPTGFHIPDPTLALLALLGLQPVSSADYEHGGCHPSREVTSLGGMLHVKHVRGGRRGSPGRPNPLIWNSTSP